MSPINLTCGGVRDEATLFSEPRTEHDLMEASSEERIPRGSRCSYAHSPSEPVDVNPGLKACSRSSGSRHASRIGVPRAF